MTSFQTILFVGLTHSEDYKFVFKGNLAHLTNVDKSFFQEICGTIYIYIYLRLIGNSQGKCYLEANALIISIYRISG